MKKKAPEKKKKVLPKPKAKPSTTKETNVPEDDITDWDDEYKSYRDISRGSDFDHYD